MLASDAAICHLARGSREHCDIVLARSDPAQLHLPTILPPLVAYQQYCSTHEPVGLLHGCQECDVRIAELIAPSQCSPQ